MKKADLKIEYVPIDSIQPYENNAKLHPDEQVEQIEESINEFGMCDPIAVWGKGNVIVEGHGRLMALQKKGATEVPIIRLDHLTDKQRKKYALVHNKLTMNSDFDLDLLNLELEEIGFDEMLDYGFESIDINIDDYDNRQTEEDGYDDTQTAPDRVSAGQVWKLGDHRLMCGDSTNKNHVSSLMNGKTADMLFTDPPYGYSYQSNGRTKTQKFDVIENDDKILDFFPCIKDFCSGFIFVCTAWKVLDDWMPLFKKYYDLTNMIIWDKGGGGIGDLKHTFSTDYEIILCSSNGKEITGKRIGSVWRVEKDSANKYVHPTQKPIGLPEIAIKNTTKQNDVVLDLFGGSGSTLMACEQLKRKCFMMEFDPKYCDVIIDRWEQFTGQRAELLSE